IGWTVHAGGVLYGGGLRSARWNRAGPGFSGRGRARRRFHFNGKGSKVAARPMAGARRRREAKGGRFLSREIPNQPPLLTGANAYRSDPLLIQLSEAMPDPVRQELDAIGRFVHASEAQELARLANTEVPRLRTHDRQGRRIDQVEYHPAYHA